MTDQTAEAKFLLDEAKYKKRVKYTLIIGVISVVISPFLFTQLPSILDFSGTGSIGDTIGGITAPIVNLIGAFLIYYSFRQQMIANGIQIESLKKERQESKDNQLIGIINNLTKICLDKIDTIEISSNFRTSKPTKGFEGIESFFKTLIRHKEEKICVITNERSISSMSQLNSNMSLLLFHIDQISSKEIKKMYLNLYYHQIHTIVYSEILNFNIVQEEVSTDKYYDSWEEVISNISDYNKIKQQFSELI